MISDTFLVAIQGTYAFSIALGITTGFLIFLAMLFFRHRRSSAYDLDGGK